MYGIMSINLIEIRIPIISLHKKWKIILNNKWIPNYYP